MQLETELKALGSKASADDFEEGLADVFAEMFPNWTTDDLLIRPRNARDYCQAIAARFRFPKEGIADEMILRRLTNVRKKARSRLPRVARTPGPKLGRVLEEFGIAADEGTFRETIRALFLEAHKEWSVDAFLGHWRDASYFCGIVSNHLGINRTIDSDTLILGTLLNMRRKGGLRGNAA